MDMLTVWMILYVFIRGLKATYGEGCIEQTSSMKVCCKLLTVKNGTVCYAWFWPVYNGMQLFAWSSATLSCNPGYVLSSSQNVLLCDGTKCTACGTCNSWNGSFPECQKQETNKTTTMTTTTTITTTTNASSNTSFSDITATTTSTTKQTETMTATFSRKIKTMEGITNLTSARQPSSTPSSIPTSSQNMSNSTPRPINNSEPFISPNDEGHILMPLYIAVPTVFVVCFIMLVVLLVICRRHQRKQNSNCRGKPVRKELPNRTETNEPYYRNLQLDAIVDGCQEVDKAYTSLCIQRENGVYETMGSGAVPMNTDKQPETIAGVQTIDDKAYSSLCISNENDAYSILRSGS